MSTPSEILTRLPATFEDAKTTGNLFFFPSTVHTHVDEFGIPVSANHRYVADTSNPSSKLMPV